MRTSKGIMRQMEDMRHIQMSDISKSDFDAFMNNISFTTPNEPLDAWVGIGFVRSMSDEEFLEFVNSASLMVNKETYDYIMNRYNKLNQ